MPTHHRSHSHTGATAASIRRKPSNGGVYEERIVVVNNPWEYMSQTYAWVAEQEFLKQAKPASRKVEEWVLNQPILFVDEHHQAPSRHYRSGSVRREAPVRRKTWEEEIYRYEIDAERWMRHEQETRRLAEERQRAKARIQEELRRIDERIRQRREEERRLFEESRVKMMANLRERERRERARFEKCVVEAWEKYEARWSELATSSEALTFANIPWPSVVSPQKADDITPPMIACFFLSPAHSPAVTKKERIRSAQLRWHPDRFRRLMNRVSAEDKAMVEQGVGIVARCLNELMEQEKGLGTSS